MGMVQFRSQRVCRAGPWNGRAGYLKRFSPEPKVKSIPGVAVVASGRMLRIGTGRLYVFTKRVRRWRRGSDILIILCRLLIHVPLRVIVRVVLRIRHIELACVGVPCLVVVRRITDIELMYRDLLCYRHRAVSTLHTDMVQLVVSRRCPGVAGGAGCERRTRLSRLPTARDRILMLVDGKRRYRIMVASGDRFTAE